MTTRLSLPLYLAASATSLFGNAAIAIVLPWLVLERTGDPALTSLVAMASAAPAAVAAFVGGHLIDRVGRRRISVLADLGSAAAVAALVLVDATLGLDVAWFVVLGIAGALFDVPGMTARQALMGDVAETSGVGLDTIASAQSVIFGLSYLAGPALAGVLLATLPAVQVVWITAACSAAAALLTAVMPLRSTSPEGPDAEASTSPLAGWAIVRGHPLLWVLLVLQLASTMIVAPLLSVVLPVHFRGLEAPEQLGLSLSAYAVGSILGSGLYGWLFARRRWGAWVASNLLYAVSFVLIASLVDFWPVAVGMALAGIGSGLMAPITQVLMIEVVPDAARGRVFGLYSALATLASPLGLGLMAGVLTVAPIQAGAIGLAVICVVISAYAILAPGIAPHIRTETEVARADDQPAG